MAKCRTCKRNGTRRRIITDGECNEYVTGTTPTIDYNSAPCNAADALGTIKFKDFVEWMYLLIV